MTSKYIQLFSKLTFSILPVRHKETSLLLLRKYIQSLSNLAFSSIPVRHKEASLLLSLDDDPYSKGNGRLLSISIEAIAKAYKQEIGIFNNRPSDEFNWYSIYPGEHYRLLNALIGIIRPVVAIEIGTFTGMGTLSIRDAMPPNSQLFTFDIKPWNEVANTHFLKEDFESPFLKQIIANIARKEDFDKFKDLFETADFIFIDGPKDGITEELFLRNLNKVSFKNQPVVMFDDIRVLNMISTWRNIRRPKLDITSFGHWSGTGLVDWNG